MNTTSFVTDTGLSVSKDVYYAILAAKMRNSIGRRIASRFAAKHGVSTRMYRMACQLQAAA